MPHNSGSTIGGAVSAGRPRPNPLTALPSKGVRPVMTAAVARPALLIEASAGGACDGHG
jgi:hypothetical protein